MASDADIWIADGAPGIRKTLHHPTPVGDLDADGHPDLAVTGEPEDDETVALLSGPFLGEHLFTDAPGLLTVDGYGESICLPQREPLDVDGDAEPDLLVAAATVDEGLVLLVQQGMPAGSLVLDPSQALTSAPSTSDTACGLAMVVPDLDGDGGQELVWPHEGFAFGASTGAVLLLLSGDLELP